MTKDERKEYKAKYYLDHKEKLREINAKYRVDHKEEAKEYNTQYRIEHEEKLKEQARENYLAHRKEKIEYAKKYSLGHKEYKKKYNAEYKLAHKDEHNEYEKQKRLIDPLFKMKCYLRNRTYSIFKAMKLDKSTKTEKLLGADWETVMAHIGSQFTFGMSWDKVGIEIHIDHKKPLALAKTEKQLIKLCNYTNLQPLWAEDNCRKSNKLNYTTNLI